MKVLGFWNNKGGTGKTSLAFQAICAFAALDSSGRYQYSTFALKQT